MGWRIDAWVHWPASRYWRRRGWGEWRRFDVIWVDQWADMRGVLESMIEDGFRDDAVRFGDAAGRYGHRWYLGIEEWVQDAATGWWSPEEEWEVDFATGWWWRQVDGLQWERDDATGWWSPVGTRRRQRGALDLRLALGYCGAARH